VLSPTLAAMLGGLVGGGHGRMQRRELAHHTLVGVLLVCVNGLRMLAKIVEARELLSAMTSEWTFAGMLPARGGSWMGREGRMVSQGRDEERTEEGQGTRT
jgi:hypothetical protein